MLSTSQTALRFRLKTRKGRFVVDQTTLGALQARALVEGGTVYSPWGDVHRRAVWPVCGRGRDRCIKPVLIVMNSGEDEATPVGSAIEIHVRCRRCEPCLKAKSAFWKLRAMHETGQSTRTWFVTLTWSDAALLRALYAVDASGLDKSQLFAARLKYLAPQVTKWLQRIRKGLRTCGETQVSFRYLLVWEEHDSEDTAENRRGMPHAHLLIHEQGQTISKRRVEREWKEGFAKARLVEGVNPAEIHKAAAYVCKYIAKSMLSRVRASAGYGLRSSPSSRKT